MGDKKGVSKNGLNNIFNTRKKLSRNEALRKYHTLSPEARDEVNKWVNRAFVLETGFPSKEKLDLKNPEHSEHIEKWLKHLDIVMGWGRDWGKPSEDMDTRIFREKIPPTPVRVLNEKEGIFEQRMSGEEFIKYVKDRIGEVPIYDTSLSITHSRARVAINIASKLLENETWLKNASDNREGRDAMVILQMAIARFSWEREYLDPREREIFDKLTKITEPHDLARAAENKLNREKNIRSFKNSFPALSEQIKKHLEYQGSQVERIYYKEFSSTKYEIRAEVIERKEVNPSTYGYRGDPYVKNIITEKKEISMGGIDLVSGLFLDPGVFNKHGTADTDWGTQLAIGDLAVLAGIGLRAIIYGTRSVLIKESRALVNELGDEVLERSMKEAIPEPAIGRLTRETVDDLPYAKTEPVDRISRRNVDPLGETLVDTKASTQRVQIQSAKDSSAIPKDIEQVNRPVDLEAKKTELDKGLNASIFTRDVNVKTLGIDTYKKASKMGLDDDTLLKYINEVEKREVQIPRKWDKLAEANQKIIKQIDDTWSLGETNARKLMAYGYDPMDVSMHIDDLVSKGLSREQITSSIEREIKLMDYYRNTYCGGKFDVAKNELSDVLGVAGDVRERLALKIHEKMWSDWKASDPKKRLYDYLSTKERNDKMGQLYEEAREIVKGVEKSVLGPTLADTATLGISAVGLTFPLKSVESDSKKKTELPKIREKRSKQDDIKDIREKKKLKPKNLKHGAI